MLGSTCDGLATEFGRKKPLFCLFVFCQIEWTAPLSSRARCTRKEKKTLSARHATHSPPPLGHAPHASAVPRGACCFPSPPPRPGTKVANFHAKEESFSFVSVLSVPLSLLWRDGVALFVRRLTSTRAPPPSSHSSSSHERASLDTAWRNESALRCETPRPSLCLPPQPLL